MTGAALEMSRTLAAVEGPQFRYLCDMSIQLDLQAITSPATNRMNFAVREGRCEGERLAGTFRSNSGDWLTFGTDLIGRVDVRATLETDDGELIYMTNTGRLVLDDKTIAALASGERLSHDRFHGRSAPLFETGSERYAWLNGITTVAVNEIGLDHVGYRIFEVL